MAIVYFDSSALVKLLAGRYGLRGADAVHLASARAVGSPELLLAVWDHGLADGAVAAGAAVVPAP